MKRLAVYRDHTLRAAEMRRHLETKAIFGAYERLQKAAHEARYNNTPFRAVDVPDFEVLHRNVRDAMLDALRREGVIPPT